MKNIFTIAKYTALEAFRDKFVWFVAALILSGIPLGVFIRNLTLYGADTILPSVFLATVSISLAVVSVLYVNIAARRELDGRIMHVILSCPISNLSYLIGKILGFWLITVIYAIFSFIMTLLLKIADFKLALIFCLALLLMQLLVIACSLFFALLLNSLAASVMISSLSWVLFSATQGVLILSYNSPDSFTRISGKVMYYLLPNYGRFDFKNMLLYNTDIPYSDLFWLLPYTLVYISIIVIATWVDFSRKEY